MGRNKFNVKSKNQAGGVTAGVINIRNSDKNKKWSIYYIAAIAAIIMLILAGLTYFGITGATMFGKNKDNISEVYNVESHDQSGGITVGKIDNLNIGKTPRQLTPKIAKQFESMLESDKDKPIIFSVNMGDSEALQFAMEIKGHLASNGWNVINDSIHQVVWRTPKYGQGIEDRPDGSIEIIIGIQE